VIVMMLFVLSPLLVGDVWLIFGSVLLCFVLFCMSQIIKMWPNKSPVVIELEPFLCELLFMVAKNHIKHLFMIIFSASQEHQSYFILCSLWYELNRESQSLECKIMRYL